MHGCGGSLPKWEYLQCVMRNAACDVPQAEMARCLGLRFVRFRLYAACCFDASCQLHVARFMPAMKPCVLYVYAYYPMLYVGAMH